MRAPAFVSFPVTALMLSAACGAGTPEAETSPSAPSATAPAPAPRTPQARAPQGEPSAEGAEGCPSGMVPIPAGPLWMGSVAGKGRPDERPQHKVQIAAFCLHRREVSVSDYEACVLNKLCKPLSKDVQLERPMQPAERDKLSAKCTARMDDNASLPANCISQDDAIKFCSWKGYRLPTEAELEYVASGGEDKLPYPWGFEAPDDAKLCWKSDGPCPVGSKPAAAFDVHDIVGGVAEWTSTPFGPYPTPPEKADQFAVRGASWQSKDADEARAQRRDARAPLYRGSELGFRCAEDR